MATTIPECVFEGVSFLYVRVCNITNLRGLAALPWHAQRPSSPRRAEWLTVVCSVPPKPLWQVTLWLIVTVRHTGEKQHRVELLQFFFFFRQRSVVGCRGKGQRVFFLWGPLSQNRQGVRVCFEELGFRFCNTHCNSAICYAPQCKEVQVSSRAKGCLAEGAVSGERCVWECCFYMWIATFSSEFIPAQLHPKTHIHLTLWATWGTARCRSFVKLPCVRTSFACELVRLTLWQLSQIWPDLSFLNHKAR